MLAKLFQLLPMLFAILMSVVALLVLWRGSRAERAALAAIVAGSVLSGMAAHHDMLWEGGETGIFLVDVAVLCAFIVILAFSDRFWPLWLTAFQIIAVMTHLARFASPRTIPLAYAFAEQLWVYPMLALLTVAAIRRDKSRSTAD